MTKAARRARNDAGLAECYPTFRARAVALIAALEDQGFRPRIQCAWRSLEEQLDLRRRGTSKVLYGLHNVTGPEGEPESLAIDLLDDDAPLEPSMRYLAALAIEAHQVGCATGLLWGLPPSVARALEAHIEAANLAAAEAFPKRGWDPCHVEPRLLTIAGAKRGQRPGPWPPRSA